MSTLLEHLAACDILTAEQWRELARLPEAKDPDPRVVAKVILQRGWLTRFQINFAATGKGKELFVDSYLLLDRLGEGAMGQVFKARHRHMNRLVALKLMRKEKLASADSVRRFYQEVQAAAALVHPNIVMAFDAGQAGASHFFSMEYVDGPDLARLVKERGVLPVAQACEYIRQAALGLQHAHERGLVHRDIKPGNLLVTSPEGGQPVVKILDLGLARLGDSFQKERHLTRMGQVIGTPDYLAPEQALDARTVDIRADIYSLGCSLYFLLVGRAPYQAESLTQLLMKHQMAATPSVRPMRPDVPPSLDAFLKQMMAKKPEYRPATPAEVATALEPLAHGESGAVAQLPVAITVPPSEHGGTWAGLSEEGEELITRLPLERGRERSREDTFDEMPRKKARVARSARGFLSRWSRPIAAGAALAVMVVLAAALVVTLGARHGILVIKVPEPGVKVFVDGQEKGVIDSKKVGRIELIPGKHRLTVKRGKEEVYTKEFTLESGGEMVLTAKWTPPVARVPGPKPAVDDAWRKQVGAMLAEEQVKAVAARLKALNPDFDGKVSPTIEGGVVTRLTLNTDNVTVISPVRALTGLQMLQCDGSVPRKGRLADLSPLVGMKLTFLSCTHTKVADLSPLVDRKTLTHLDCAATSVSNLSHLKNLKLTRFSCAATQVSDLSPLAGMKLTDLNCSFTRVSDLSPLKGMPLTFLNCGSTRVSDLSPLKDMELTILSCADTRVADLGPLKGMKLRHLNLYGTPVSDLSPLKDMKLAELVCLNTRVADLSPLKGMPLETLHCDFKPERDADILRSLQTLKTINYKPAKEFWKEVDAKKQEKTLAEPDRRGTLSWSARSPEGRAVARVPGNQENGIGILSRNGPWADSGEKPHAEARR
jgi:serine/threonine protein kinase